VLEDAIARQPGVADGRAVSRDVQHLPAAAEHRLDALRDALVEPPGTEGAARHEQRGSAGIELEQGERLRAGREAVEVLDLAPQRQTHDTTVADAGGGEDRADVRRVARAEPIGDAGAGVGLVEDERPLLARRRGVGGSGRVPAEAHDGVDPALAQDLARALDARLPPAGEAHRIRVRTARERQPRNRHELVAARGHEARLEPLGGSQHEHLGVGLPLAQAVGGREQGVHVARGAPAGHQIHGHCANSWRRGSWRAKDSTMPTASRVVTSEEPPAEMKGSGTPSTGSSPSTTAMFTSAWPMIHTIAMLVARRAKGSTWRRMMRTKHTVSTAKRATTSRAPTSPSSSPMTAKMKSVSASGSQFHFASELPRPTPKTPPLASACQPCSGW